MEEGLLVEVLNLVPNDYLLTVKRSITGEILIEKDNCHTDILSHLKNMNYWVDFSKDDKNKEAYINIIGSDHRRNIHAYKKWLLSQKDKFKNKNDIALHLAKYILYANATESLRNKQVSKFITYSNITCINKSSFSYQFASMLKASFDRGEICWAYPIDWMVWVDVDGSAYYNNGLVNEKQDFIFIPESYLNNADLESFKHVDSSGEFKDADAQVNHRDVLYDYCKDIINKAGIKLNI